MIGFGYFKEMYDANIRASLHDLVRPERRAVVVGMMNAIGWPARRRLYAQLDYVVDDILLLENFR
jgi:hypothetical protein